LSGILRHDVDEWWDRIRIRFDIQLAESYYPAAEHAEKQD
jgi:hypothetical protein